MHKQADKLAQHHSTKFQGLPIIVEWPKGSTRVGENEDGSEFRTEMQADYGYIDDTEGKDGESMDVYVGSNPNAKYVYAVEQVDENGETDEYKLMLGFDSLEDAEAMFAAHAGEEHMGDISEIPFEYLFDMVEENVEEHLGEPKKGAQTAEYEAFAYIEWGEAYDKRRVSFDEYKGTWELTDWDASDALDLGKQVGECSSLEEAKSKLEQAVFNLGEPKSFIDFRLGPDAYIVRKQDYLNPGEKKFLDDVGIDADIKPDMNRPIPKAKPEVPQFDDADKARLKGLGVIGKQQDKSADIKPDMKHTVIDAFIKNYEHEVDFYQECAALAQDKLDQALQEAGIKAVVSARAKRPNRLQKKLVKRDPKKHYKTFRDIYDDIIDLAGVRVALYLPADQEDVGKIIEQVFQPVRPPKHFPEDRDPGDSLGYVATHYLVHLRPNALRRKELRYADTQIEVQVASVLMHAWAEVTHDLIYKPEKGQLTQEEMNILRDLNDLVQAGEAQLEKLQGAIEGRNGEHLRFEIASSLSKVATTHDFIAALEKLADIPTEIDGVPVYAAGAAPGRAQRLIWVWNEQYKTHTMDGGRIGDHTKFFKYMDNPQGKIPPNLYDQSVRGYATVSPGLKQVTLSLSDANHPNNRFIPSQTIQHFEEQYPGYKVVAEQSRWASYIKARLASFRFQADEIDDRLKLEFEKAKYQQVDRPVTPDDFYYLRALKRIGQGRRYDQLSEEERTKVVALAQELKTNEPIED